MENRVLQFASDYQEGACKSIIDRLVETNMESTQGYGSDRYTRSAIERIRRALKKSDAQVELLVGGTQTNATVIDAVLKGYEGVVAAETGHVALHEAGAIEFGGHKVLTVPAMKGKLKSQVLSEYLRDFFADENHEHMVQPGMVYISQPTEYGTLYSLEELEDISRVAHSCSLPLYVDGARLAYALASDENDVALEDLARLCDVFYIGGTKCGALFGEAVVIPDPSFIKHFLTIKKQHGGLLAKGRLLGIQFDELFRDDLYLRIGESAVRYARLIQSEISKNDRISLYFPTPTNQSFLVVPNDRLKWLSEFVTYSFWEKNDEKSTVIRLATSWATTEEDTQRLLEIIRNI
ncbi:MAG: low specificity L-threonine aldolase [Spirochaetales bacterium]|nr:low specificity L-threonine aldolase [Spirochaetales bacterium]